MYWASYLAVELKLCDGRAAQSSRGGGGELRADGFGSADRWNWSVPCQPQNVCWQIGKRGFRVQVCNGSLGPRREHKQKYPATHIISGILPTLGLGSRTRDPHAHTLS